MTDRFPRPLPKWLREEVNRELDERHQKAINYGRHWWQRERKWPRPGRRNIDAAGWGGGQ